jgi:hypothetical protein
MCIYYVYAYLRKDGTPYYIGKGSGKRAWKHQKWEAFKTPLDETRIILIETNLTEIGALALERRIICWYGRKDLKTGILRNKTDGGEGVAGYKHSDDSLKKMRGRTFTDSHIKNLSISLTGRKLTPKHIANSASGNTGKKQSKETIEKRIKHFIGKPSKLKGTVAIKKTCPHCSKTGGAGPMARYHFNNCKTI